MPSAAVLSVMQMLQHSGSEVPFRAGLLEMPLGAADLLWVISFSLGGEGLAPVLFVAGGWHGAAQHRLAFAAA